MKAYRTLTASEIAGLELRGNSAEKWSDIEVSDDFTPAQLCGCRLEGRVQIGSRAVLINSAVRNYRIGPRSRIESVTRLECRAASAFGNGVAVATMNECEGRKVAIYDRLTAQTAYILAIYRHRPRTIGRIEALIGAYAAARTDTMGEVGCDCRITGARFIREVRIGDRAVVEGASVLENGTLCDEVQVGADVKARDFIMAEGARVSNGVILERCFAGECVTLDKGFSASESLFFANSHCENGEAASIFAGPYTVSHHKSSLLIAGMFSFFNAGSGTNQSNHLFKSGAVHQSVHLRGCKFASGAYIMSPAIEGAFTMILGHHSFHHDTTAFPYSYLIEKDGRSMLMPGANLVSYGAVRDVEKWPRRDRRKAQRDVIDFEEYNPYICQSMITAVNTLNTLQEADPDAEVYTYKKVFIRPTLLGRGLKLYNKAIVASLGAMLAKGSASEECDGRGRWLDVAGQYITKRAVDGLLDEVDAGTVESLEAMNARFRTFHARYDDYARSWALGAYADLLGHAPSAAEVDEAVAAGRNAHAAMRRTTDADCARDCSLDMAVSYGLDCDTPEEAEADFRNVRGLNQNA